MARVTSLLSIGMLVRTGVTVGENAIVGAGAVVTKDVESDTASGRNPS